MATAHRYSDRSRFYLACFTGPDKKRTQLPTKSTLHSVALDVALALEKAGHWAREGRLTHERVMAILGGLPSIDFSVVEKIRELLNTFLTVCGADPIADETVRGWCKSWLKNQEASTAPRTQEKYEGLIDEFLEFIGDAADKSLRLLTMKKVQDFRDRLVAAGVSAKSVNFAIKTLRTCFNLAVAQGYCAFNRASAVRLQTSENEDTIEKVPFTVEQVETLLRFAPSREWRELIICGFYIGDRLGNLVRLRFEFFDLKNRTLTYTPGKQRRSHKAKELTIPVHPALLAIIRAHGRDKGPLFPSLSQKKVSGKTGLSLTFRDIMNEAGIKYETKKPAGPRGRSVHSLGFHSLRRSFNSGLANEGVRQETRQILIGHASKEVNDIYTSLEIETMRGEINKLPTLKLPAEPAP